MNIPASFSITVPQDRQIVMLANQSNTTLIGAPNSYVWRCCWRIAINPPSTKTGLNPTRCSCKSPNFTSAINFRIYMDLHFEGCPIAHWVIFYSSGDCRCRFLFFLGACFENIQKMWIVLHFRYLQKFLLQKFPQGYRIPCKQKAQDVVSRLYILTMRFQHLTFTKTQHDMNPTR